MQETLYCVAARSVCGMLRAKSAMLRESRVTTITSLFSGTFSARPRPWRPLSPKVWTCVGGLAIPLWATWPALSLQTREIPALECIAIIFAVAWLALSRLERRMPGADLVPSTWRSWIPALAFALGETGATVFFLLATHHIAAAEANLISYLWPGMTVGLGALFGVFELRLRHLIGIALGFVGAAVLMGFGTLSLSFAGMGLALLGAVSWAAYCVFRLKWKAATEPLLARGFGISAVLCGGLHFLLEPTVIPNIGSAAAIAVIGIVPAAFANWTWDEGFRRGDSRLLAVMAYATPLCSALLLALCGLEAFTWKILMGAILIVSAGLLSRADA
jgi:drug/metabolite transporter (DMT)-like permease